MNKILLVAVSVLLSNVSFAADGFIMPGFADLQRQTGTQDDQTMYLDGDTVRGFLSGSQNALVGTLGGTLDSLKGVRLTKNESSQNLDVLVEMTNDLT